MDNLIILVFGIVSVLFCFFLPDLIMPLVYYFKDLKPRKFPFRLLLHMKLTDIKPLVKYVKDNNITCISKDPEIYEKLYERRS